MKQIKKRLTYANVMSSIAIFLLLGGATALAAGLAKNSVGTKQLKKNAVTAAKIKKNAVTTTKIKDGAVTGAKVNVSGFPKVPSAANADNAANAANAANANAVEGSTLRKFFYSSAEPTTAETTILSLGGLTLKASCEGGVVQLRATTSVDDTEIHAGGTYGFVEPFYQELDNFDTGEEINLIEAEGDSVQGTFTYATPAGGVVTGTFLSEEGGFAEYETDCIVAGNAIG